MRFIYSLLKISALIFLFSTAALAQETTGGIQGTVKDPSGAVVPHAKVTVTGSTLVRSKEEETDNAGYYRFANLPPGSYTITVVAQGFKTLKRDGLVLEVGHLPVVDFSLEVGVASAIVEVSAASVPLIDPTTSRTMTNVTEDVINYVPHGESFQSVLQFAPSARNEPLMGMAGSGFAATGGCSPTGCSNGGNAGYQVGGAADSENGYLVEGQDTANLIGGYSHTNVPFIFIDEVQVKTSGVEAENGGTLGGVANVIMKKGGNQYHGAVDILYNSDAMNGAPNDYSRYDPSAVSTPTSWGYIDPTYQQYSPKKDTLKDFLPGFSFGGPIKRDRIWFFAASQPQLYKLRRTVNFGAQQPGLGLLNFDQNTQSYYTNARIDASVTSKLRVYASWLYQYQRQSGLNLPFADSTQGFNNVSAGSPPSNFAHFIGFTAPNNTTNIGADWTISPRLISTTRFGYYFENYRNFGYPSGGVVYAWANSGIGGTDAQGNPLPTNLQQANGYATAASNISTTTVNANKRTQFNEDVAWVKSGWRGTHNFKFGYQLNQLTNSLSQRWNEPYVQVNPGTQVPYSPVSPTGTANCAQFTNAPTANPPGRGYAGCYGLYGTLTLFDFGDGGYAQSRNHGLFFQDAWTVGRGVTINAGLRIEKEYLPAEDQPTGGISKPINFSWGDKIAPRLGAAWDVMRNGKLKLFGGYGVFNDIMKLNLAISSFGGEYWQNCAYALDTANYTTIIPAYTNTLPPRYCAGPSASSEGNFQGGNTPAGLTFLENQNFRTFPTTCSTCTVTEEGVAPNLKPYRQHESTLGADYQLSKDLALEARWDRRRLDHAIEDSAIFDPATGSETFVIVNPGQGVNRTFDGFYNFLYGTSSGCASLSTGCPPNNIPAQRNYDGVEIRLTKAYGNHWTGMFSYTYSRLWGNYSGLTNTNFGDAEGGRNSPNNGRAFDEPFFSWDAFGQSASGLMPTDRPNAFKGWTYYDLKEGKNLKTDFGLFAYLYQGTPQTSMADVGYGFPGFQSPSFPTFLAGSGKWLDVSQNPTTGAITVGNPRVYRSPWFNQADLSVGQSFKFKESKQLRFAANATNIFNRRAAATYFPYINSWYAQNFLMPGGTFIGNGAAFYYAAEHPYNISQTLNAPFAAAGGPVTISSQYGKPNLFQPSRNIRLELRFTF
jgi:Carboxypeptidase regulatory-like domain/TonB dependent receptor